jgi:hypothetical protein
MGRTTFKPPALAGALQAQQPTGATAAAAGPASKFRPPGLRAPARPLLLPAKRPAPAPAPSVAPPTLPAFSLPGLKRRKAAAPGTCTAAAAPAPAPAAAGSESAAAPPPGAAGSAGARHAGGGGGTARAVAPCAATAQAASPVAADAGPRAGEGAAPAPEPPLHEGARAAGTPAAATAAAAESADGSQLAPEPAAPPRAAPLAVAPLPAPAAAELPAASDLGIRMGMPSLSHLMREWGVAEAAGAHACQPHGPPHGGKGCAACPRMRSRLNAHPLAPFPRASQTAAALPRCPLGAPAAGAAGLVCRAALQRMQGVLRPAATATAPAAALPARAGALARRAARDSGPRAMAPPCADPSLWPAPSAQLEERVVVMDWGLQPEGAAEEAPGEEQVPGEEQTLEGPAGTQAAAEAPGGSGAPQPAADMAAQQAAPRARDAGGGCGSGRGAGCRQLPPPTALHEFQAPGGASGDGEPRGGGGGRAGGNDGAAVAAAAAAGLALDCGGLLGFGGLSLDALRALVE